MPKLHLQKESLMGWFKKQQQDTQNPSVDEPPVEKVKEHGPYDVSERPAPENYLDFGALKVPLITGLQIQPILSDDRQSIERLNLLVANSAIQVLVIAAPRSGGVADNLLTDTAKSFEAQNANVVRAPGRWGEELQITIPVVTPEGGSGISPMRVVFVEGPAWALRLDIVGPAAVEEAAFVKAAVLIDNLIVERDKEPRAPLSLIRMNIPQDVEITPVENSVS